MDRIYIKDLKDYEKDAVLVKGWVYKINDLGKIAFVTLRDKTGLVQLVDERGSFHKLRLETCIEVYGKKVNNPISPNGIEIHVDSLNIVSGTNYDKLPFEINTEDINAALETQMDHRSISLRNPKVRAVFKIQEAVADCFRSYLKDNYFSEIHTPKIISSSTEGGSEMFTVNYFDRRAFLAQSPQFYKQMMVGAGFERVFEVGHAYRAELHNTYRHLNEYVSLDVEMGFIKDEEDLMNLEEGYLKYLFSFLNDECKDELKQYNIDLLKIESIPRIPLSKAQDIILEMYGKSSPNGNLDNEGEVLFSKYVKETLNSDFVFLTKYPASKRPMYTMPDEVFEGTTKSFDLIYKGLEITTGGQRIHDYQMLKDNIIKFGLKPEDFDFYLESFKYGMPPHGGFAIGLERLTMKILNLSNIREATLLPRDLKRLTP